MRHFSRVARTPVWFTYHELWDMLDEAQQYGQKKLIRYFPSKVRFGIYVSREKNIVMKVTEKDYIKTRRYAYIHATQSSDEGVDYNGGVR